MRNGSSPTLLWWVSVLRRLAVILGAVTLVLVAVAALGLLLFLLWVEFTAYMQSEAKFPPSADHTAISAAIATLIAGIVTVFGVAAAVIAGFYAKEQLLIGRRVALGDNLFRIDEALRQHAVVHAKLRPGGDWSIIGPDNQLRKKVDGPVFPKDGPDIESYMGLFERIQVLVAADMIDIGTVDRLYSYRLFNIADNPIIYQEKFVKRGYGWRDFIKLWKALGALENNKSKTQPNKEILGHLRSV